MALIVEANMGLRISDILKLKLSDIVKDGDRHRLNIREQKTKKERFFTVLTEAYQHLKIYCGKWNQARRADIQIQGARRTKQITKFVII